jgi:cytoskeletal protein CcmA (bactofilin family)
MKTISYLWIPLCVLFINQTKTAPRDTEETVQIVLPDANFSSINITKLLTASALSVAGPVTLNDSLIVNNDATINHLSVYGDATLCDNVTICNDLVVGGTLTVPNLITNLVFTDLSLSGNETIDGTLSVGGATTLSTLSTSGDATINGDLTINGSLSIPGTFSPDNIDLVDSTPTQGNITKNTIRWLTNFGTNNTFLGKAAGNFTLTAFAIQNTAVGDSSSSSITDGANNTALGQATFPALNTGSSNIAIGRGAGATLTTGSGNIYINANAGTSTENTTTRIGTSQTAAFVAGINGVTSAGATKSLVLVDTNGQLGTGGSVTSPLTLNNANLSLTGTSILSTASNATIGGALSVTGTSTLAGITGSSLSLSGNETVSGTLSVAGTSTLATINGSSLSLSGNETVSGTLSVSGISTLGTVNASSISVSGNETVSGNLSVTGTSTQGNLTVTNNANFNNATVSGTLSIAGAFAPNNIDLVDSTALAGKITKSLANFIINPGGSNTFVGKNSGSFALTSGVNNTGFGVNALTSVNTSAQDNTAVGPNALQNLTIGSYNIAAGTSAGSSYVTTESSNIVIGSSGNLGDNNTIRIGTNGAGTGQQNRCFVAGIYGETVGAASTVIINSNNQLGTIVSSRRFKENIRSISDATAQKFMQIEPVSFTYKNDPQETIQYGFIVEELSEALPELVIYDENNIPFTIQYHLLYALLHKLIVDTKKRIDLMDERILALQNQINALTSR